MIVKIGARDGDSDASRQEHVPDSRGAPTPGDGVYRRRIRSLSDLSLKAFGHRDVLQEFDEVDYFLAILTPTPGVHEPAAEVGKSGTGLKAMLFSSDCSSRGHSSLKPLFEEADQHLEVHVGSGQSRVIEQGKNVVAAPQTPCKESLLGLGHDGYFDKPTIHVKPSKRLWQSTLDGHFRKNLASKGGKAGYKKEVTEINVGGLSKYHVSPSCFKRKNIMGPDSFLEPQEGKFFTRFPDDDDQFLQIKRPKIRNNNFRVSLLLEDSTFKAVRCKKRASGSSFENDEDQLSLGTTKRRKVLPLPVMQIKSTECNDHDVEIETDPIHDGHGKELVGSHTERGHGPRIKKNGQPDGRFKKNTSAFLPLGGSPHFTQLLIQDIQQDSGPHVKDKSLNPIVDETQSKMTKDNRPDARIKNRRYSGLNTKIKDIIGGDWSQTTDKQAFAGIGGENHAKKLPEVQKNGVRKPKRVQLKRLVGKPDVDLPSVNNLSSLRVVKSLWSPPKQMKHITEAGLIESVVPHRLAKCSKFASLHQLDDPAKVEKVCGRQLSPLLKESDDCSASERTVSDCSPEDYNQPGPFIISTMLDKPQNSRESKEGRLPPPMKARLWETVGETKQVEFQNTTAAGYTAANDLSEVSSMPKKTEVLALQIEVLHHGKTAADDLYEVSSMAKKTDVSAQQIETMHHGNLKAISKVSDSTLGTTLQPTTGKQMEMNSNQTVISDLDMTPRSPLNLKSGEQTGQVSSGDCEVPNCVPRMTPRTKKLTDAMQNFLHQKATLLQQWKEMELGKMHPMALIGRSCKIFWPLDNEWYPGVIHEYNPQSRKHRIDYEDDEREWVHLGKERVKLHVSSEESKVLEMSFGEASLTERKKLDADELAVLASGVEGCQGAFGHGDLVWAKIKGYPLWPAFVMDEEHASASSLEPASREQTVPVQFFGSYDHARISLKKVVQFSKGIVHKYHTKCKRPVFEQGLQEVERYLKECKLPEQMAQLQEEAVAVGNKRADDLTSTDETDEDDQDIVKDGNLGFRPDIGPNSMFPLELGNLRVLTIGKIVRDSEQFHTENHIWTEGYIAIRKFASMKDPETIVEYKMEVLRHPAIPSTPLFRVTPEDERAVEDISASACWKKILIKIQRAKEKAGLCIATLLEKKRQAFRSGPSMFGFGNPKVSKLIQALPYARVCSKFTAWIEKPPPDNGVEELAPAGYRPMEFEWKHLDRCNVCYLDEEYVDNQLLQCDKCRTMVHMNCYGELEPPDGDLWLCNMCRPGAPRRMPICCLCPVAGGAMKATTDGRWAHLTCAMWTPETCLVDVKRMEPVDGINSINKERWKLICTVCKIPYGACIQCSKPHCRVAFHPLCARAADLCMEVLEDKISSITDLEGGLQLLTYCKKHKVPVTQGASTRQQSLQTLSVPQNCSALCHPRNPSGCARAEPYSAASRRGHRQPEALAAALAKRFFVQNRPYIVTGCQRNFPKADVKYSGVRPWSWHWKHSKSSSASNFEGTSHEIGDDEKTPQSTSERYRLMRSTLHERLTFGKSAIHGWGVFTKRPHGVGDMVIEYAGEIVRPIIADIRERRSYDSLVGAGTYMFRIDDERVVDATHAGSIAHLINHSCEPNCYSRVVTASGDDHIIIFAKRDIPEGEELTYDYRFASKDELLTCYCGCTGCRGFVNSLDPEEEPTRVIASRSELTKWMG